MPKQIFWGLALAVILCESNKDEKSKDSISVLLNGKEFAMEELWGQGKNLSELLKNVPNPF